MVHCTHHEKIHFPEHPRRARGSIAVRGVLDAGVTTSAHLLLGRQEPTAATPVVSGTQHRTAWGEEAYQFGRGTHEDARNGLHAGVGHWVSG